MGDDRYYEELAAAEAERLHQIDGDAEHHEFMAQVLAQAMLEEYLAAEEEAEEDELDMRLGTGDFEPVEDAEEMALRLGVDELEPHAAQPEAVQQDMVEPWTPELLDAVVRRVDAAVALVPPAVAPPPPVEAAAAAAATAVAVATATEEPVPPAVHDTDAIGLPQQNDDFWSVLRRLRASSSKHRPAVDHMVEQRVAVDHMVTRRVTFDDMVERRVIPRVRDLALLPTPDIEPLGPPNLQLVPLEGTPPASLDQTQ